MSDCLPHFLRILCISSVLFVLLGLFNHRERVASPDLPANNLEQLMNTDGILSYHHHSSTKNSKINDKGFTGQLITDIRRPHETAYSNNIKSEYKNSLWIYSDIMRALLHMKGVFPHPFSGKEILS